MLSGGSLHKNTGARQAERNCAVVRKRVSKSGRKDPSVGIGGGELSGGGNKGKMKVDAELVFEVKEENQRRSE